MLIVLIFGEEIVREICAYGPQSGRTMAEKWQFYDNELACEWNLRSNAEMVLDLGSFNGHDENRIDRFEGIHGRNSFGKRNVEGEMLLEFCNEKELCVANTWFKKNEERKITYSSRGNRSEIDFVLVGRNDRKYLKNVKAVPGYL